LCPSASLLLTPSHNAVLRKCVLLIIGWLNTRERWILSNETFYGFPPSFNETDIRISNRLSIPTD
jgi:hypothetical protein